MDFVQCILKESNTGFEKNLNSDFTNGKAYIQMANQNF